MNAYTFSAMNFDHTAITVFKIHSKADTAEEALNLARKAVKTYGITDAGYAEYSANCDNFTWNDMMLIVNDSDFIRICDKLDIKMEIIAETDININSDEQLMDDITISIDKITWNSNDKKLPESTILFNMNPAKEIKNELSNIYKSHAESYHITDIS